MSVQDLGARLASAREARQISQADAAAVLGVSRVLVSHWENGKRRPNELALERLASIYAISLTALLDGEAPVSPSVGMAELLYRDADGGIDARARAGLTDFVAFLDAYSDLKGSLHVREEPLLDQSPFTLHRDFGTKDDIRRKAEEVRDWLQLGSGPLGDLSGLLDDKGITVYRTALGADLKLSVSGAFLHHPRLGLSIAVNVETTPGRQLFTMAHELAHALFHSTENRHLVSYWGRSDERERFADAWASEFLMPIESLRGAAEALGVKRIKHVDEVIHLQRHFGVSYAMALVRLRQAHLVDQQTFDDLRHQSPVGMARRLGYAIDPEEWRQDPRRWRLERYPRRFLRLVTRALFEERMSPASAASLLSITIDEVAELVEPARDTDPEVTRELGELENVDGRSAA